MTAGTINHEGDQAIIATLFDVMDYKRAEDEQVNIYELRIAVGKRHLLRKEDIMMDLHDGIGGITSNISMFSELGQKAYSIKSFKKTPVTFRGFPRRELRRSAVSCRAWIAENSAGARWLQNFVIMGRKLWIRTK